MKKIFDVDIETLFMPLHARVAAVDGALTPLSKAHILFKSAAFHICGSAFYVGETISRAEQSKIAVIPILWVAAFAAHAFWLSRKNYRRLRSLALLANG